MTASLPFSCPARRTTGIPPPAATTTTVENANGAGRDGSEDEFFVIRDAELSN
jgi:hypothetical protein